MGVGDQVNILMACIRTRSTRPAIDARGRCRLDHDFRFNFESTIRRRTFQRTTSGKSERTRVVGICPSCIDRSVSNS